MDSLRVARQVPVPISAADSRTITSRLIARRRAMASPTTPEPTTIQSTFSIWLPDDVFFMGFLMDLVSYKGFLNLRAQQKIEPQNHQI